MSSTNHGPSIAALDSTGIFLWVNRAWRRRAEAYGVVPDPRGASYFDGIVETLHAAWCVRSDSSMSTQPFYKPSKRIVITGGPGAGKTAVLELARHGLCPHVEVLPEAASIVFGGGFPRRNSDPERRAGQRAIYWVQSELESLAQSNDELATVLCDRGTLDGLAYWPGHRAEFFTELDTTMYAELQRYEAVIHLRVPADAGSYIGTVLRRETHREALEIDARLLEVWSEHPRRIIVDSTTDFLAKAAAALEAIRSSFEDHACDRQATRSGVR